MNTGSLIRELELLKNGKKFDEKGLENLRLEAKFHPKIWKKYGYLLKDVSIEQITTTKVKKRGFLSKLSTKSPVNTEKSKNADTSAFNSGKNWGF